MRTSSFNNSYPYQTMSATASSHSQSNPTQVRSCQGSQGESLQSHQCCELGSYARVVNMTYSWLEEAKKSGDQARMESAVNSVLRALGNQDSIVQDLDSENNVSWPFARAEIRDPAGTVLVLIHSEAMPASYQLISRGCECFPPICL